TLEPLAHQHDAVEARITLYAEIAVDEQDALRHAPAAQRGAPAHQHDREIVSARRDALGITPRERVTRQATPTSLPRARLLVTGPKHHCGPARQRGPRLIA